MDTSLATNGLPDVSFTATAIDTVGGSGSVVAEACANLEDYASNIDTFIENLTAQKDAIVQGWEGEAAAALESAFPILIEAFTAIPPSIRSISEWATSTMSRYVAKDNDTASKISAIMGGN